MNKLTVSDLYVSDSLLLGILCFSFFLCAFCAGAETGLMSINRYRLKHLSKTDPKAQRITKLLAHPDRLLGVILIGSTFATAIGASIANQLAERVWGEWGIFIAPVLLTLAFLVFAEVMPKTLAALKPEATSRFVAPAIQVMLVFLYPLVWLASTVSNAILKLFGVMVSARGSDSLTSDELRTIVNEASGLIPSHHQTMLLSILDLEKVRVDQIMIPRNDVVGIDLDDPMQTIIDDLKNIEHTLLPVYRSDLDNVVGILHTRNLVKIFSHGEINEQALMEAMEEPYFVPEGTSLHTQLLHFQQNKRRMALVVDEYGDVLGLVALEDILEEIVGQFTTGVSDNLPDVKALEDGSFLVEGSASVRDLNRAQHWEFPTHGPSTLNGLIIETLETLPQEGLSVMIEGYPVEIVTVKDNMVKVAKIFPRLKEEDENLT